MRGATGAGEGKLDVGVDAHAPNDQAGPLIYVDSSNSNKCDVTRAFSSQLAFEGDSTRYHELRKPRGLRLDFNNVAKAHLPSRFFEHSGADPGVVVERVREIRQAR